MLWPDVWEETNAEWCPQSNERAAEGAESSLSLRGELRGTYHCAAAMTTTPSHEEASVQRADSQEQVEPMCIASPGGTIYHPGA